MKSLRNKRNDELEKIRMEWFERLKVEIWNFSTIIMKESTCIYFFFKINKITEPIY